MQNPCLVLFVSFLFIALNLPAQEVKPTPDGHGAHGGHGAVPGLKTELFKGITEADSMKLGSAPKTVKVVLVATFTADNHGMNFNGYSHGKATWFIPKGWTVEVEFINPSPVPHSAIVVEKPDIKKLQVAEPWFEGAAVEKHLQGIALSKASFKFIPDEEGEFAFACGFPAHALAGHWVALEITGEDTLPKLQLGEGKVREIE